MSLTLGLNTALSGLLTNQRGLDVISQNVVNVNTPGYSRKVLNLESRVLLGRGAGVQEGTVTRMVDESLLKDIRRQSASLEQLRVEKEYYERIDDLFGEVGAETSIAHGISALREAFESLGTEINKPSVQWATSQAGLTVANQLNAMTDQLQAFRLSADHDLETTVTEINEKLLNIHDLNNKIVKHSATSTGTADLEDKRDTAIDELSKLIDIQYYRREDNSMIVFTTAGELLLDNQPQTVSYTANTAISPWMTAAGHNFNTISVAGGTTDLGSTIRGGKMRALLDFRDTKLVNLQANLDQVALQMRESVNQIHSRGTTLPMASSRFDGTRVFANQGDVIPNSVASAANLYYGTTSVAATVTWDNTGTSPTQATLTGAAAFPASLVVGSTFTIDNPTNSRNSGTYRVAAVAGATLTVEKVNVRQTIQLGGTDDVVLATFDSNGNQLEQTTLDTIMQTDYSGDYTSATAGSNRSLMDFEAKTSHAFWTVNEVTAHIEGWLQANNYTNASVNLNSDGKLVLDLGDSQVSLSFRDQGSSTAGSAQKDATIKFDVNGDGTGDQTVNGFVNFFGLNDFFGSSSENYVYESEIQASTFATNQVRYLTLLDNTGQVGTEMTIPRGASLQDIADKINERSSTVDSGLLDTTSWTLSSQASFVVSDANGVRVTLTLPAAAPGTVSLYEVAGMLTQNGVTASVVDDRGGQRLRVIDDNGKELSVAVTNGTVAATGRLLGDTLQLEQKSRMQASVVPEGSGCRLRIVQVEGSEMYLSSRETTGNLIGDLGLARGVTGAAGSLQLRADLESAPQKVSRGAVQWDADNSKYYLSEGDNTSALELGKLFATKQTMASAGNIFAGSYTLDEYAAASVTMVTTQAAQTLDSFEYQKTLNDSLSFQRSSFSGVNLDEEVANMIDFQQAYSAAARVISAIKEMLDILTDAVR